MPNGAICLFAVEVERVEPQLESGVLIRVLEDWCQPFPRFLPLLPEPTTAAVSARCFDQYPEIVSVSPSQHGFTRIESMLIASFLEIQ